VKQCEQCQTYFKAKVTYQIYCSPECRDVATRAKIAERYSLSKKRRRINKIRKCLGGCNTKLSVYNDSGFCANCNVSAKTVKKMLRQIKGYFDYEQDN
jgi:hypothetical protein